MRWAVVLLLTAAGSLRAGLDHYLNNVVDVTDSDVAVARWAAQNLPPDALLAVQDIGAIGYLAPQPLVDMAGIVTPEILPYLRGELRGAHPSGLEGWATYLEQRRVDFVVLFPGVLSRRPACRRCGDARSSGRARGDAREQHHDDRLGAARAGDAVGTRRRRRTLTFFRGSRRRRPCPAPGAGAFPVD